MRLLNNLANNKKKKNTTSNFYIGAPEAEAETTVNSRIKLSEAFSDYLSVFRELSSEKFMIIGRKGAGKTAIAEYLYENAQNSPLSFASFIRLKDIEIEKLVQIGKKENIVIEEKLLFEWIILIKITQLLTKNEAVKNIPQYKNLSRFLNNNSGFIELNQREIIEVIKDTRGEIKIELFKRAFSGIAKKYFSSKETKAPYYKVIPALKEAVIDCLQQSFHTENEYYLIFDDLDINFNEKDQNSIDELINLIRIVRDYNINIFGKSGLNVKIILLLRTDIKISLNKADTAKMFNSYNVDLQWYQHDIYKRNEDDLALKKLVTKRIEINFKREDIQYNPNNIWDSFISKNEKFGEKGSFKYILDYTFFRPRDLILFFLPISKLMFKIPLSYENIKILIDKFAFSVIEELKNELSGFFTEEDIKSIFRALSHLYDYPFTMDELERKLNNQGFFPLIETITKQLFDYSVIGNLINNTQVIFKHRRNEYENINVRTNERFIVHQIVKHYLMMHYKNNW